MIQHPETVDEYRAELARMEAYWREHGWIEPAARRYQRLQREMEALEAKEGLTDDPRDRPAFAITLEDHGDRIIWRLREDDIQVASGAAETETDGMDIHGLAWGHAFAEARQELARREAADAARHDVPTYHSDQLGAVTIPEED